jgi:hypothetical protein
VAALMQRKLDCRGWRLVVTGHSLGAGAAALIALHLYGRFGGARPCGLRIWGLMCRVQRRLPAAVALQPHLYGRFGGARSFQCSAACTDWDCGSISVGPAVTCMHPFGDCSRMM